jgi:L1 cell adhesion molecule like protein
MYNMLTSLQYESEQKTLEGVANPIMTKIYSEGGAPGGMPGGQAPPPGAGEDGPTVEEVD